jgi:hypothetical protein
MRTQADPAWAPPVDAVVDLNEDNFDNVRICLPGRNGRPTVISRLFLTVLWLLQVGVLSCGPFTRQVIAGKLVLVEFYAPWFVAPTLVTCVGQKFVLQFCAT